MHTYLKGVASGRRVFASRAFNISTIAFLQSSLSSLLIIFLNSQTSYANLIKEEEEEEESRL